MMCWNTKGPLFMLHVFAVLGSLLSWFCVVDIGRADSMDLETRRSASPLACTDQEVLWSARSVPITTSSPESRIHSKATISSRVVNWQREGFKSKTSSGMQRTACDIRELVFHGRMYYEYSETEAYPELSGIPGLGQWFLVLLLTKEPKNHHQSSWYHSRMSKKKPRIINHFLPHSRDSLS